VRGYIDKLLVSNANPEDQQPGLTSARHKSSRQSKATPDFHLACHYLSLP